MKLIRFEFIKSFREYGKDILMITAVRADDTICRQIEEIPRFWFLKVFPNERATAYVDVHHHHYGLKMDDERTREEKMTSFFAPLEGKSCCFKQPHNIQMEIICITTRRIFSPRVLYSVFLCGITQNTCSVPIFWPSPSSPKCAKKAKIWRRKLRGLLLVWCACTWRPSGEIMLLGEKQVLRDAEFKLT